MPSQKGLVGATYFVCPSHVVQNLKIQDLEARTIIHPHTRSAK